MTKRTRDTGSKAKARKPKLRRETVKDLDAKAGGKNVKGGYLAYTAQCLATAKCATATCAATQCACGGATFYCYIN